MEPENHITSVSNEEIMCEIKLVRQEMKDLHWQLLLKLTEHMDEMQKEIRLLHFKLAAKSSNVKEDNTNGPSDNEIMSKDKEFYDDNILLSDLSNYAQQNLDEKEKIELEYDESLCNNESTPVILEVTTTSNPEDEFGVISERLDVQNDGIIPTTDFTLKTPQSATGIANVGQISKYLYNESTHIANCRDRHCLLCQSLCVTTRSSKNISNEQRSQWKCSVCLKYFRRKYNLKNHMRCHTGEKPFQCHVCRRFFRSKQALNYHSHKHDQNYRLIKPSKSDIGNYKLTSKEKEVKRNKNDKSKTSKATSLAFIGKSTITPSLLNIQEEKQELQCDNEEKTSCEVNSSDDVDSDSTNGASWKCPVCMKCFQRKANVKSHMRIHTGEKPYKCNVCLRRFAVPYSLQVHKRIHSSEKLFE